MKAPGKLVMLWDHTPKHLADGVYQTNFSKNFVCALKIFLRFENTLWIQKLD
jgi:hypothetical protein